MTVTHSTVGTIHAATLISDGSQFFQCNCTVILSFLTYMWRYLVALTTLWSTLMHLISMQTRTSRVKTHPLQFKPSLSSLFNRFSTFHMLREMWIFYFPPYIIISNHPPFRQQWFNDGDDENQLSRLAHDQTSKHERERRLLTWCEMQITSGC